MKDQDGNECSEFQGEPGQGIQGAQNAIPKSPYFMSKADSLPPSLRKIINYGYNSTSVIHKLLSKLAKLPVTIEHRGTKQTPSSRHTQSAGDRPMDHDLSIAAASSCALPSNGVSHIPHLPNNTTGRRFL